MGSRYGGVVNVLNSYRGSRRETGGEPSTDGPTELLAVIGAAGGPKGWADSLGNHQLTSTRSGILKAQAVEQAATGLQQRGVERPHDLAGLSPDRLDELKGTWRAIPGQRSGISWRYLLLLIGMPEVKPDRMIVRFVSAAVGRKSDLGTTAELVRAAAPELGTDVRTLDHRIWRFQSGRG